MRIGLFCCIVSAGFMACGDPAQDDVGSEVYAPATSEELAEARQQLARASSATIRFITCDNRVPSFTTVDRSVVNGLRRPPTRHQAFSGRLTMALAGSRSIVHYR